MLKLGFFDQNSTKNEEEKYIFLDIDGVIYIGAAFDKQHIKQPYLNEMRSSPLLKALIPSEVLDSLHIGDISAALNFNQEALTNVWRLCKKHHAKIVISSAWRKDRSLEQLKAIFTIATYAPYVRIAPDLVDVFKKIYDEKNLGNYIIDATPVLNTTRGDEIEQWKNQHSAKSFVILDDDPCDFEQRFSENFVYCNHLFYEHSLYEKADQILCPSLLYGLAH